MVKSAVVLSEVRSPDREAEKGTARFTVTGSD